MDRNGGVTLQLADPDLHEVLQRVCRLIAAAGGRAWLVGGSVRDSARGESARDLDLEVFGLPADRLQAALATDFELDLVGRSFGILKLHGLPIDVGLPRRESKSGRGHRGFLVDPDPYLTLPDAARRRDFTLNAIYLDPLTGEVEDPCDGLSDLRRGVLRHTSLAFGEDPLRVLRAMQLAARFELAVAPETVELCRCATREGLPAERIFDEWVKLVTLGEKPSLGLAFLRDCGWLDYFPELAALVGCPQDPRWHPEGDVWTHTLHALDAFAAEREHDHWEDLVVGLAVLCHDLGKPDTTTIEGERIRSIGHGQAGVKRTRDLLGVLTEQKRLLAEVEVLVREHLHPAELYKAGASDAAVRRLAARVGRIDRLVRVARADALGRPPLTGDGFPAGDWLLDTARRLDVLAGAPEPVVRGRDLVALGLKPGAWFGDLLERCYEAQLAGRITDQEQGRAFVAKLLAAERDAGERDDGE